MSRRHKQIDTETNDNIQWTESQVDGSPKRSRFPLSEFSLLNKIIKYTNEKLASERAMAKAQEKQIVESISQAISKALHDKAIEVTDEWVKTPRSYFEQETFMPQADEEFTVKATKGRGRTFLSRLINTVADSKIVSYVKDSFEAAKKKCVELFENATQFASCCLSALFKTFAPEDDPYGKLSHYYSLIEHELPGLRSRRTLSSYYKWFVEWKPSVTYETPKDKKKRHRHKIWKKLISWICNYLLEKAPQYAYAYT